MSSDSTFTLSFVSEHRYIELFSSMSEGEDFQGSRNDTSSGGYGSSNSYGGGYGNDSYGSGYGGGGRKARGVPELMDLTS